MTVKNPKLSLTLLAGIFALLFLFLPGHTDAAWRRGIGFVWLVTGCLWMTAWTRRRRHLNVEGT